MPSDLAVPFDKDRRDVTVAGRLTWLLVALSPVLFAIACWNPGGATGIQRLALAYALPISAVELAVFACAVAAGLNLREALGQVPRWSQLALALIVAIAIVTSQL